MTIAVTGATGHLGRLVIDALRADDSTEDLIAVVRDEEKAQDLAAQGVTIRVADYEDRQALSAALSGVSSLLLISSNEVGKRFTQHKNVIDAAVTEGVEHLVYTSVLHADTTPLILASEHLETERYLAELDVPRTLLRNGWYTENYAQLVTAGRTTGRIVTATAGGRVSSASRRDYAIAAATVLRDRAHIGSVYELVGDIAWNFDEFAATLSDVIGSPVEHVSVTESELVTALSEQGVPEADAAFLAALDTDASKGYLEDTSDDLTRLLGRRPTPLADVLASL